MDSLNFHDGNIHDLIERRHLDVRHIGNRKLQMHSSLLRRLTLENQLEGHQGCVNSIAWNAEGSLLISGSDDTRMNIWSYSSRKLLHSIDTGHSANIFCTKFVPETCDDLVVSGAADAEVRLFRLSRLSGRAEDNGIVPTALFHCHTNRVKKLAVEDGNPNVVWSASEDGTLRQHDFREGVTCPPAGSSRQECRNVLLDLRCGAKRSLAEPPRQSLALKSVNISPTRPHLLLIGGSDAFARLYDRRMLPPLTSGRQKMPPPPCVNYICPMHLSDRSRSSLHLTHVTFSPNSEEVLLNYSTEHVYLMDLSHADGCTMQYTSEDVLKLTSFTPVLNGSMQQTSDIFPHGFSSKGNIAAKLDKCRKLLQVAEKSLREGSSYFYGIEACNEVLDGYDQVIGTALRHECLCTRAALFLKRKWKNDVHMAIKDCNKARKINNSSVRALHLMSEALSQLGRHKEALEFSVAAQSLAPFDTEIAEMVEDIRKRIAAAESEKDKANSGAPKPEPGSGRVLLLSDIIHRSEANSDASQDGPRSERGDSDYDEELELDLDTSMSGDESRDIDSNILRGSLNLRIHQRGDSARENSSTNGSSGSPTTSNEDGANYKPEAAIDMKRRYVGHCNIGTDIKQANFIGPEGAYVSCGSDDGRWFIWEKRTGRLIKVLVGDGAGKSRSSLHLTHVTFSPNSEEVLLNYSTEHVYLMDLSHADGCTMQYTSEDVLKLTSFTPVLNGSMQQTSDIFPHGFSSKGNIAAKLDKCRKLLQVAEKSLREGSSYFYGIEACNEVLDGYDQVIGTALRHECLCTRAALFLKRKWKNDVHMAIKDCNKARKINNSSVRALHLMSEALSQLGRHKEALEFSVAAQSLAPFDTEIAEMVEDIRKRIAAAESEKDKANSGAPKPEPGSGRVLLLSDIIHRSEANSDASQDGPRSERGDSDYDEELELDLDTSMSGDESRDIDSNILRGSLNLRIHQRGDSARENSSTNGSSGSPTTSNEDGANYKPEAAIDMKRRYVGHCNIGTDIKQANFIGPEGAYVSCGSDDGRWFIWEKRTGRLIKVLVGDGAVVNCVQGHPFDCAVATSGIDSTIKIWSPSASVPSLVARGIAGPETADIMEAIQSNQQKLNHNHETILPFELFERFRMHEFNEGTFHPFECAQS